MYWVVPGAGILFHSALGLQGRFTAGVARKSAG